MIVAVGIVILLFIMIGLFIWGLMKGASDADAHMEELMHQDEKQILFCSTCEKCNIEFSWTEKDVLVKDKYGARHTIACPQCGKLMKQHIK